MNQPEQRSPEWFEQRGGKLTGSNVGAALGCSPWKAPEDLIRQMVREYHGAESEFKGNIATSYGANHEPMALLDYEMTTGNKVIECGFFIHPEHDWMGASPDGLIGDNCIIEIKCPYGQRDKTPPEFKTAEEQPHYYAQMQVELACTGRASCEFYQWSEHGDKTEIVRYDPHWFADKLPLLRAFYDRYLSELDNPAHLEPKHKEINTRAAKILIDEYNDLSDAIERAADRKKEVMQELIQLADGRNALIHGRKLTEVERKGAVDYKKIPELKSADLEKYRKKPSKFWRLS